MDMGRGDDILTGLEKERWYTDRTRAGQVVFLVDIYVLEIDVGN